MITRNVGSQRRERAREAAWEEWTTRNYGNKGELGLVGMKGERGIVGDQGRKGDKGGKGESAKQDKQVQYHKPTGNNVCGAKKVHSFLNFPIIWFFLNEKRKTIERDKTIPGHMDKDNTNLIYYRVFKH